MHSNNTPGASPAGNTLGFKCEQEVHGRDRLKCRRDYFTLGLLIPRRTLAGLTALR